MRRTPLRRKARLRNTRQAPLRKTGATKKKREARYAKYLKSPEWREKRRQVVERSGGRCEQQILYCHYPAIPSLGLRALDEFGRCTEKATEVHHLTYARFGMELLDDLKHLCKRCHERIEAEQRPWNRGRTREKAS